VKRKQELSAFSSTKPKSNEPRWATIEDIRSIAGYENLSDGEALGILDSIRQLVSLMANFIQKQHEQE
jgi:hypothetical protein